MLNCLFKVIFYGFLLTSKSSQPSAMYVNYYCDELLFFQSSLIIHKILNIDAGSTFGSQEPPFMVTKIWVRAQGKSLQSMS